MREVDSMDRLSQIDGGEGDEGEPVDYGHVSDEYESANGRSQHIVVER